MPAGPGRHRAGIGGPGDAGRPAGWFRDDLWWYRNGVTEGLVLLAAWGEFLLLVGALAVFVLRGADRR
jgi:hypothetical protein